ncbi:helix-turn-helix domain-containing protein [Yeosuana marina]|uniref:helix-turn-helix domain-containing protein n=1 Tax=Yeosuana marina TaxID=1565536 RepID=UPI0030C8A690
MTEVIKKRPNTNFVYQLMGEFADMVAHKVVEAIKETEDLLTQTIPIEASIVEQENPNELLTIKEVCEILKVSRSTIYDWMDKDILLPDTNIGRSPRYKRCSLNEFINYKKD